MRSLLGGGKYSIINIWIIALILFVGYFSSVFARESSVLDKIKQANQSVSQSTIEKTAATSSVIKKPTEPRTIYPKKRLQADQSGRLYLPSVQAVTVWGAGVMYCSIVARENLHRLTGLPYYIGLDMDGTQISQQDAVYLTQKGRKENVFVVVDTGVNLVEKMNEIAPLYTGTVYDVFLYQPYKDGEVYRADMAGVDSKSRYARRYFWQAHRITIFLATDNNWYVLDPLRGARTRDPQLLDEYAVRNEFNGWARHVKVPPYHLDMDYRTLVSTGDMQELSVISGSLVKIDYIAVIADNGLGYVKMREEPKITSTQLTIIPVGKSLAIENVQDNWYRVTYEGYSGWISTQHVNIQKKYIMLENILADLYQVLRTDTSPLLQEGTLSQKKFATIENNDIHIKLLEGMNYTSADGAFLSSDQARQALLQSALQKKDIAFILVRELYHQGAHQDAHLNKQEMERAFLHVFQRLTNVITLGSMQLQVLTDTMTVPLENKDDYHFEVGSVVLVVEPHQYIGTGAHSISLMMRNPLTGKKIIMNKDFVIDTTVKGKHILSQTIVPDVSYHNFLSHLWKQIKPFRAQYLFVIL